MKDKYKEKHCCVCSGVCLHTKELIGYCEKHDPNKRWNSIKSIQKSKESE